MFGPLFALLTFALTSLQLLGYTGLLRVRVAKEAAFRVSALDLIEKSKAKCSELAAKNTEMAEAAKMEVAAIREELAREK